MKLIHWLLMLAQAPFRCTKCNSPLINGQCINHVADEMAKDTAIVTMEGE